MKAHLRAVSFMTEHGLIAQGWTFAFDRATSRLGQCNYTKKRITISKYFTSAATEEEFDQTLIHETAHALLPVSDRGHGPRWKMKAKSLGYTGKRTAYNPYRDPRRREQPVFTTRAVAGAGNPVAPKVLITALSATQGAPKVGDMLVLPNGAKLKVQEVTTQQTRAVEVGTGDVWNLNTSDAFKFIQR